MERVRKERCGDCKKWEPTTGNFGFCKANAPQATILQADERDKFIIVWPSTGMDDWCINDFEMEEINGSKKIRDNIPGLVSCLTATYGRYSVLCEAISCFLEQTYNNRELIILNNSNIPIICDFPKVVVYNEPKYTTLGDCRNRLLELARGEFIRTWDDDDLYLPWTLEQGVREIGNYPAFKPDESWDSQRNEIYTLGDNVYEAAMLIRTDFARKFGYKSSGGDEHMPLLKGLQIDLLGCKRAAVHPSYVYRWDTQLHRISGSLGNGSIYERTKNWKNANTDFGNGRKIEKVSLEKYWHDVEEAEKTVHRIWIDK